MPELEVRRPARRRRPRAAGLGGAVHARRARPRPDRRRDPRQPAGAARTAARADARRSWPAASGCPARMRSRAGSRRATSAARRALRRARRLMLVAAAEPVGDPLLLLARGRAARDRAGGRGRRPRHGLLTIGERVTFRHPLVRSAVYRSAPRQERRAVHLALAEATDRGARPGPPRVASGRCGGGARRGGRRRARALGRPRAGARRARRRGGVPAARRRADAGPGAARRARAGRRAGEPPGRRVRRGSRAAGHGGGRAARRAPARADRPAARPARVRLEPRHRRAAAACCAPPTARAAGHRARARDVRGRVLRGAVRGPARRARRGARGGAGGRAARRADRMTSPRPPTCCWTRWSPLADDYDAAVPPVPGGVADGSPATRSRRRNGCAGCGRAASSPSRCGMTSAADLLSRRSVEIARETGARSASWRSHSARAPPCSCSAASSPPPPRRSPRRSRSRRRRGSAPRRTARCSSRRGGAGRARRETLIELTDREANGRGEGIGLAISEYARAVLCNGLGQYEEALAAASSASEPSRGRRGELGR